MKSITIIIPNFNTKELIEENLPILIHHASSVGNEVEIIVVDDGSSDGSAEFLKENFPQVKVISLDNNYGFSHACNVGVKEAKGDIIYLLNSDVRVCAGFLEPLISYFDEEDVFAVSSMEIQEGDQEQQPLEDIVIPLVKFKLGIFWYWYEKVPKYIRSGVEVFCVSGGHTAYNKDKFLSLNGYDNIFYPFYAEDGDICWRAWQMGWRSIYEPKSLVRHKLQGTIGKFYTQSQAQTIHWKNRFLLTWKDLDLGRLLIAHLLFIIPQLFLLPILGRKEFTFGFFKALKQVPELLRSRRRDRIENPVYSDRQLFHIFSSPKNVNVKNIIEEKAGVNLRVRPDPHNTQFAEAMATYHFVRDLVKNKRVLDAGCGFGYGTNYLSKWADEIIGLDFSLEAIDWAVNNYPDKKIKFLLSDIKKLDFSDNYFDVVCLFEVIHQVGEYHNLLKELRRVLKKDGLFLISTRRRKREQIISQPDHVVLFNAVELEELLSKSGFYDVEMYGLGRPEMIGSLEGELKNIRKLDLFGLKRIVPRRLISFSVYIISKLKGIKPPQELSYKDFNISKDTIDTDPGILSICRKA